MFQANATCVILHTNNYHSFNHTENCFKVQEVYLLASMDFNVYKQSLIANHLECENGKFCTIWNQNYIIKSNNNNGCGDKPRNACNSFQVPEAL